MLLKAGDAKMFCLAGVAAKAGLIEVNTRGAMAGQDGVLPLRERVFLGSTCNKALRQTVEEYRERAVAEPTVAAQAREPHAVSA